MLLQAEKVVLAVEFLTHKNQLLESKISVIKRENKLGLTTSSILNTGQQEVQDLSKWDKGKLI